MGSAWGRTNLLITMHWTMGGFTHQPGLGLKRLDRSLGCIDSTMGPSNGADQAREQGSP